MKKLRMLIALFALVAVPTASFAHGGGLDAYGGHVDRKSGTYHFHRGPLAGKSYPSKAAALRALRALTSSKPQPAVPQRTKEADAALVIRKASTTNRVKALIALLVRKGLITEAELAAELKR